MKFNRDEGNTMAAPNIKKVELRIIFDRSIDEGESDLLHAEMDEIHGANYGDAWEVLYGGGSMIMGVVVRQDIVKTIETIDAWLAGVGWDNS